MSDHKNSIVAHLIAYQADLDAHLPEHAQELIEAYEHGDDVEHILDQPYSVAEDRLKSLRFWTAADWRSALMLRRIQGRTDEYERLEGPAKKIIAKLEGE